MQTLTQTNNQNEAKIPSRGTYNSKLWRCHYQEILCLDLFRWWCNYCKSRILLFSTHSSVYSQSFFLIPAADPWGTAHQSHGFHFLIQLWLKVTTGRTLKWLQHLSKHLQIILQKIVSMCERETKNVLLSDWRSFHLLLVEQSIKKKKKKVGLQTFILLWYLTFL